MEAQVKSIVVSDSNHYFSFRDEACFLMEESANDVVRLYKAMLSVLYDEDEMASVISIEEGSDSRVIENIAQDAFSGFYDGLIHAFSVLPYSLERCNALIEISRHLDEEYLVYNALESAFNSESGVDVEKKAWHLIGYIPRKECAFKHAIAIQTIRTFLTRVKVMDDLDDKEAELYLDMTKDMVDELELSLLGDDLSDIIWNDGGNIARHWRFLKAMQDYGILRYSFDSSQELVRDVKYSFDLDPITAAPRLRRLVCQTLGGSKRRILQAPFEFNDFVSPVVMDYGNNAMMVMDEGEVFMVRANDLYISVEPL